MTTFSKIALAAALLTGTSGIVAVPAFAQKDKPAEPTFKFSSGEIVKAIGAAKTAVDAKDWAAAEPLVAQVEAQAKNDDDKYAAASLRLVLESNKAQAAGGANKTALVGPYTALLANPKTPPGNLASYALDLGIIYYNSKQYAQATTYFARAQQLGSTEPNLQSMLVKSKIQAGDASGGLADLEAMIAQQSASGGKAEEQLYRFAIGKSVTAKDSAGTLTWMKRYLVAYPTAKNWRDMIKIYGLQQGSLITPSRTQTLDLYRLMRATKSLAGQYDYEDYAYKAIQSGLPFEARAVLAEGKASGKIPSGASTAASLTTQANTGVASEGSLASLETRAKASADGKLASQTGDAQLGAGNYAKAVALYRLALSKGGANANDVNTRLGIALAMSGDKAGAKTAFAAVTGTPSAEIAALWSTYLDATPTA